jgi:formate--tetrahydrofolate ligase
MAKTRIASSLEIAQVAELRPIADIAEEAGLLPDEVELYGRYKAKIALSVLERLRGRPDGRLICVTAVTPTKAGEGKTTTSVSLTQGVGAIGKRVVLCLREASLGPVFALCDIAIGLGACQRVRPTDGLRYHRRVRSDGDRRSRPRPLRPARAARPHHRRLYLRLGSRLPPSS